MSIKELFQADVRRLMAQNGQPMGPKNEFGWPSSFGWEDHEAVRHCRKWGDGCSWVVPDDAPVSEHSYTMFDGTDNTGLNESGLEVEGCHCICGRYQNVTLRYVATVGEILNKLLVD